MIIFLIKSKPQQISEKESKYLWTIFMESQLDFWIDLIFSNWYIECYCKRGKLHSDFSLQGFSFTED